MYVRPQVQARVNRPQRATVIALIFGVVGVNFAVPAGASISPPSSVDTVGRLVLGAMLVCVGGALVLRPGEMERGTETASVWLLLLAGVAATLFAVRLVIVHVL